MTSKHVTYTIPKKLDAVLHMKVGRGKMSKFVTEALWAALRREENELLMQFLQADKDAANIEVKNDFAGIEGEDFHGEADFGEEE